MKHGIDIIYICHLYVIAQNPPLLLLNSSYNEAEGFVIFSRIFRQNRGNMEKRLKTYLSYIKDQVQAELSPEESGRIKQELLIQIGFFQHERLIHLIVTVTFALLTFLSLFFSFTYESIISILLFALFFLLLIPYIRHYYILENGVQQLYQYYNDLK
jgi:hypothetical protein